VRKFFVSTTKILNSSRRSSRVYNVISVFNKSSGKWIIDCFNLLPEQLHPQISVEELIECEVIVKNNPTVQALAKEVGTFIKSELIYRLKHIILMIFDAGVLPEQIFCDGWSIGYDERFPQQRRVQQALMFARFSEHDNLYAHPLVN
jgi:primary-amine oxidase